MAGSGEFTRVGNTRAENANLNSSITAGTINPPGDLVAKLSAATPAVGTSGTTISTAASGGGSTFSKAIPDDAVLVICDSAGAVDTMEAVCVNGAVASGATSATIDTHYWSIAHAAGSVVFLVSFKAYLAMMDTTTTPADNTLGTECVFTGYARQVIAQVAPTAADPPVVSNNASITFGPLSGADGSKVERYLTLMDASSGGTISNAYAWWDVGSGATRTPNANDSINIAVGALTMQSYH